MSSSLSEPRPRGASKEPRVTDPLTTQPEIPTGSEAETQPKDYRLGILFIHGMGEQVRGDTITQMGDAVTEWLRRWLGNDRFRIKNATLRSREGTAAGTVSPSTSGRANATIVLESKDASGDRRQTWLLAESWWADAFRQASFGEVAWWAIGVGPWLIAGQLAGLRARLMLPGSGLIQLVIDSLVFVVLFLTAAVAAALIAPLALVLLLMSLIPVPVVGGVAQSLARNLAGSFGDLLIFVRSPVRFAAMAERVREDVEWLHSECDRIMVVAHSQGSAVAWHAIRRTAQADRHKPPGERTKLALFLTFGQAFRKLKALHRLHTRVGGGRQLEFAILAFVSTVLLLVVASTGYYAVTALIGAGGDTAKVDAMTWWALLVATAALIVVGLLQQRLSTIAAANNSKAQDLIVCDLAEVREGLPGFKWLDLWASADPAPDGPLFTPPVDGIASYRIRNLASTALDHTVYFSNTTEFVSAVAFAAGSLAPSGPLGSTAIPGRLRHAAAVRDLRVTALACGRVAFFAALGAALIGLRTALPNIGDAIVAFLTWLPFVPDSVDKWPGVVRGILGAVLVTLAGVAAWWLVTGGWHAVIRMDESRFFARQPLIAWPRWAIAWAVAAGLVPTLAIFALAVLRSDVSFVLWHFGLSALGLLVVVRLMRTTEPRLSDPID